MRDRVKWKLKTRVTDLKYLEEKTKEKKKINVIKNILL